nr:MAG TPA: hypothetical protein [Inoviridae sp.]
MCFQAFLMSPLKLYSPFWAQLYYSSFWAKSQ